MAQHASRRLNWARLTRIATIARLLCQEETLGNEVEGAWESAEARWFDVGFQVRTFLASLEGTEFLGETFPVFWPNLSAIVYNLLLGQAAEFDDLTAWSHPCIEDLARLPELRVERHGEAFRTVEELTSRALDHADGRFMVGFTDMYAGIDCTAGLRGTEQMCLDMVMDPDGLKVLIELSRKCRGPPRPRRPERASAALPDAGPPSARPAAVPLDIRCGQCYSHTRWRTPSCNRTRDVVTHAPGYAAFPLMQYATFGYISKPSGVLYPSGIVKQAFSLPSTQPPRQCPPPSVACE